MRTTAVSLAIVAVLAAGCQTKTVQPDPNGGAVNSAAAKAGKGAPVTGIGAWAKASDGLTFRVSKLARAKADEYTAVGKAGDPLIVATIQIRNGSSKPFDSSLVQVNAHLGVDGRQGDEVYDNTYGSHKGGMIVQGRTSTDQYAFLVKDPAEFKHVSIEIQPGFDYDSFTFEGAI